MKDYKAFIYTVVVLLLLNSCISYKSSLLLQHKDLNGDTSLVFKPRPYELDYKISKGDFLDIRVQSPDEASLSYFNNKNASTSESSLYLSSYLVSSLGTIYMPLLDTISVEHLTTGELRAKLIKKLSRYYKILDVRVKLVSYKVTFIGEVATPITVPIYNLNTTIFEGVSLAGNTGIYANTRNITILRKENGSVVAKKLDLNKLSIIESDYYYLRPGDVIYFQPVRAKLLKPNLSLFSSILSVISIGLTFGLLINSK